jgi:hypothetical protein
LTAKAWTVTTREGSNVEREHFEALDDALDALGRRLVALEPGASREEVVIIGRRIEPARQVVARVEVAGPRRTCGGVDLRGDGSTEAFTGRLRRAVIERRGGESAADALRRALAT